MSALALFKARAELQVPDTLDHEDLTEALEQLSDELMVEVTPA